MIFIPWLAIAAVASVAVLTSCTGIIFRWIEASLDDKNEQDATPLSKPMKDIFRHFFPPAILDKVTVKWNCHGLLGSDTEGMTFGTKIFVEHPNNPCDFDAMVLLLHELVHVTQYERDGFALFACNYPWQFIWSGFNYEEMTYEAEAYAVSRNQYNRDLLQGLIDELCASGKKIPDNLLLWCGPCLS
jgi:hypothetical protein